MKAHRQGFTVIELVVAISIIGLLATVSIFSYGSWRERTARNEVISDLKQAVIAMDGVRNFSDGYPTSLPASFTESRNVTVQYRSGDASRFCIEGTSKVIGQVKYKVNTTISKEPQPGIC
jgi:prepilin-type N-terminal cleavage/methylation domain-containing protein